MSRNDGSGRTLRDTPLGAEAAAYHGLMGRTLFEKIWDRHVVRDVAGEPTLVYVDLHLVHEVTSPQAFEGLRLAGRRVRRPDLTVATMDHNVPTLPGPIDGPDGEGAARSPAGELRRVRDRAVRDGVGPRGHRPRDRPRARAHAAREDDRLRRQPHVDPRGARRACIRHRHVRGRARARDADARAAAAQDDAARVRRDASARADREGHDPRRHRPGRCRRRRRIRRRVRRRGRRGALDGAAPDDLQHVDRVGCPGRARGARRDDLRLPRGTALRALRRGLGAGRRGLAHAPIRPGRHVRQPRRRGREQAGAAGDVGHEPRHGRAGQRLGPRPRLVRGSRRSGSRDAGARLHGPEARAAASRRSASTASSSAPARMPASRTCGPLPTSCAAAPSTLE